MVFPEFNAFKGILFGYVRVFRISSPYEIQYGKNNKLFIFFKYGKQNLKKIFRFLHMKL